MKIKLKKIIYENGDVSIKTEYNNIPFQEIKVILEQIVEIDESKFALLGEKNE